MIYVPFAIVLFVIGTLIWAYIIGLQVERREAAERINRLAERAAARERWDALKPRPITHYTYNDGLQADRELRACEAQNRYNPGHSLVDRGLQAESVAGGTGPVLAPTVGSPSMDRPGFRPCAPLTMERPLVRGRSKSTGLAAGAFDSRSQDELLQADRELEVPSDAFTDQP